MTVTTTGRTYGGLSAEQRAHGRRERLIDAGRALIAESGVAAITVDLVCEHAKLSKRYFYTEFPTKEALLDACAEELFGRLKIQVESGVETTRREERIEAAVRAVVHTLATDPADARLYMECPGFPRLRARQLRAVREFSELMAAQAVSFTGRPERSVDRVLATQLLVAGTTDLIIAWLHGDIDTDEKTLIATVTATALVGVAGL